MVSSKLSQLPGHTKIYKAINLHKFGELNLRFVAIRTRYWEAELWVMDDRPQKGVMSSFCWALNRVKHSSCVLICCHSTSSPGVSWLKEQQIKIHQYTHDVLHFLELLPPLIHQLVPSQKRQPSAQPKPVSPGHVTREDHLVIGLRCGGMEPIRTGTGGICFESQLE